MKIVCGRLGIAVCCGGHLGARSCKILAAHAMFVPRYGEKRAGAEGTKVPILFFLQRSSGKSGDRAQTNALRSTCAAVVGLVGACAQVRDALRRGALLGSHSAPRPKKCGYLPTIARVHARCTVIANRADVATRSFSAA